MFLVTGRARHAGLPLLDQYLRGMSIHQIQMVGYVWNLETAKSAQACGLDVHDVHEFFVSLTSGQPAESVQIEDFIHHAMRLEILRHSTLILAD